MDKLDVKLWSLAAKGQIVPDRSLLKTPEQIAAIRKSADLNTAVLDHVAAHIHAGMSTAEIDKLVYDFTTEHGGIPAPLNYEGFPKSVCTSINNVICHGIPDENEILEEGDIINVDVSTILDGYFSDASRMFTIGNVSPEAEKIVRVTKECVELGLKEAKPWGHLGDQPSCTEEWLLCRRRNRWTRNRSGIPRRSFRMLCRTKGKRDGSRPRYDVYNRADDQRR